MFTALRPFRNLLPLLHYCSVPVTLFTCIQIQPDSLYFKLVNVYFNAKPFVTFNVKIYLSSFVVSNSVSNFDYQFNPLLFFLFHLSDFRIANEFPDCVGKVDVISDAKNIKTLLKIPFSDSSVSMIIHRVDKSLLLDEFDVSSHLLRAEEKQWEWLRQFLCKYLTNNKEYGPLVPRKGTSRDSIQSSSMLDKFLHYSILNSSDSMTEENEAHDLNAISQKNEETSIPESMTLSSNQNRSAGSWSLDFSLENINGELDTLEEAYSNGRYSEASLRNLLWTFENIQMLVGSNMPIFGDAKHPAVSLRLRDVNKPIKILTGLDYWLDNLMCSVPEVVMCYHLDGIVQKYELIKTEEIPFLKNSQFSPKVIRDIAQNILTFLKTKATKSGHTYWLFKGKGADAVKLYDLTSLCSCYMTEESHNPYALPVAMLLYRVAKNLKDSNAQSKSTVYRLLSNCLNLVDLKKYLQIAISGRYQMADLLIPNGINISSPKKNSGNMEEDDEDEFFDTPENSATEGEDEESSEETYSEITIEKLCTDSSTTEKNRTKTAKSEKSSKDIFKKSWLTRCKESLQMLKTNVEQISDKLLEEEEEERKLKESRTKCVDEKLASVDPLRPIPRTCKVEPNTCKQELISQALASKKQFRNTLECQLVGNIQKVAHVYSVLAELKTNEKHFDASFQILKMGLKCNQIVKKLLSINNKENYSPDNLSCLFGLAGDNHMLPLKMSSVESSSTQVIYEKEFLSLFQKLNLDCDISHYDWCFPVAPLVDREKLHLALRCYETALRLRKKKKPESTKKGRSGRTAKSDALDRRLKRKLGNAFNEISALYMEKLNEIVNNSQGNGDVEHRISKIWIHKCSTFLEKGFKIFESVNDVINCVLLLSNTGKLMRITAHVYAPKRKDGKRLEFSSNEKQYLAKAIENYQLAIDTLKGASKKDKSGAKNLNSLAMRIKWELSATYFGIAVTIQDFAPVSTYSWEQIEKDIDSHYQKALKILDTSDFDSHVSFACLAGVRKGTIYYRLGSLYHHKLRNMSENDPKRKQTFNLADSYYDKSHEMFYLWEYKNDFLNSLLERIAMHEAALEIYSGFSIKLKANQQIIRILMKVRKVMSMTLEDDHDKRECFTFLKLLFERLLKAIENIIKTYSYKASKYQDILRKWKRLHLEASKMTIRNNDFESLEKSICSVFDSCSQLFN